MFRLNTQRTFKAPVDITILTDQGEEQTGQFRATFRVVDKNAAAEQADKPLLDVVLVDVHDLDLFRGDIALQGEDRVNAAKADPAIATALVAAYWEHLVKKPRAKT